MKYHLTKYKRSQSSIEFVSLIVVASLLIIIILFLSYDQFNDIGKEKEYLLLKDMALNLRGEILIASKSLDGYTRNFIIPEFLEFYKFTINLDTTQLILKSDNLELFYFVPSVNGNFTKGANIISKSDGMIYLN